MGFKKSYDSQSETSSFVKIKTNKQTKKQTCIICTQTDDDIILWPRISGSPQSYNLKSHP